MTKSKGILKPWTAKDLDIMQRLFADTSNTDLAVMLGRTPYSVIQKAHVLGLKKSRDYIRYKQKRSKVACFKKGNLSHNKGKKQSEYMSEQAIERCRGTQFKAGDKVHNERKDLDISLRTGGDGNTYQYIRVSKAKWMLYNRWVWEQHTGEKLGRGDVIRAIDGNRLNVEFSNLERITNKENMLRNTIQRYPVEVKKAIRLVQRVSKTIKKKENEQE